MPQLAIVGSMTKGHPDKYPPVSLKGGVPTATIGGIPILTEKTTIHIHTNIKKPYDTHSGKFTASNPNITMNGDKVLFTGDKASCGDTINRFYRTLFV